jgi:hypothetical protein
MANLASVDPATLPGPANNRNGTASITVGSGATAVPTTGQIWPRGNW